MKTQYGYQTSNGYVGWYSTRRAATNAAKKDNMSIGLVATKKQLTGK